MPARRALAALAAPALVAAVASTVAAGRPGAAQPAHTQLDRSATAPRASSTLDPTLTAKIEGKLAKSTASSYAVVVDIDGVGRVVDVHGGKALLPASTQKLFTTLPLLLADPGRRLVTSVAATSAPRGGVVHGDLVLRASGDPTLIVAHVKDLAHQMRAAGLRTVTGRLVLARGDLPTYTRHDGWKSSFVPGDVGPLSPFPLHYDQIRHTSWYLQHPTAGNVTIVRQVWRKAGIVIRGGNSYVRTASAAYPLASHSSATIGTIVRHTLTNSINFYAEQLLSIEGGHAVVDRTAAQAGVSGTSTATDGSGLSSLDRQTARGEVALLGYAHRSAVGARLLSSLAVACETGTLEHLMCHTAAAHQVFAKTGTLAHAKQLAGYTTDAQGRFVTFSILANGVRSLDAATTAIDNVAVLLRHYSG